MPPKARPTPQARLPTPGTPPGGLGDVGSVAPPPGRFAASPTGHQPFAHPDAAHQTGSSRISVRWHRARRGIAQRASPLLLPFALAFALAGCSDTSEELASWRPPPKTETAPYWINPDSGAVRQVNRWGAAGRTEEAELMKRIAGQPVAQWFAGERPVMDSRALTRRAHRAKGTAVLVVYNIPHRDCGQYSAGGARDGAAYRAWLAKFARGIGEYPALVVLEPDAVPHMVDGCTPAQFHEERYQLLREAVATLGRLPRTRVYIDAGNSAWIADPKSLADPLRRAGVRQADGFALNVSNFQTTSSSTRYGHRLAKALGGAHFVIDTSRNGRGPLPGAERDAWCNPPGRGLGTPPTDDTGTPLVDAYLWVKAPGESDGECRGAPPAGRWWPEYALQLARGGAVSDPSGER